MKDPAQVEPRARQALAALLRQWSPTEIADADQTGREHLETITITLPDPDPASDRALDNVHDQEDVLGLCGYSLTAQAAQGKLGRADRRDALVEQLMTVLAAPGGGSVILVGRDDVGKTTLVHELVGRIQEGRVPAALSEREVWFVTANDLIAGMRYTGEWQGRVQKLVGQVRSGRQILFMDDPSQILDAGRWSQSDNNMGRFLRPFIERGEVTIICACTPEGYAAGVRSEVSFMHAFQRIDVSEPEEADTLAIVQAAARRLETLHNISIDPSATTAALRLSRRFLPYRALPGKAVQVLTTAVQDTGSAGADSAVALGEAEVIRSFTRTTGLPTFLLADDVPLRLPEVGAYFEERLLGQPEAVEAMTDLVTVLKAGLNDPAKPLGSFFVVGPTGVGKTELAKVLAEFLFGSRDRMVRFDMSEYAAADALPRLIGSGWQRESEGELTRPVREQPFCVVLLDELEKAHPDVFDALLGVLGEGRLTDATGRTADFRNAIIIMTSNLGAARRELHSVGFAAPVEDAEAMRAHFVAEAERFFRPEFINRLDRIIVFHPLTPAAMRLITRRELGKLLMREGIVRRNLLVEIDDAVIELLAAEGFHPQYGARPLQRQIERRVIMPLARLLVDQRADSRHLLRFSVRDGQIHLSLVPLEAPEEAPPVTRVRPTAGERRLETDLAAVARMIDGLREAAAAEEAGPILQGLRAEVSRLLTRTHTPTFWDEPAAAREVLGRVYQLERVLKRLDAVVDRADFLAEKGRQLRIHGDRRRVPELAAEAERLADEFAYVQMELAGACAGQGRDQVLLRVTPLGPESIAWAAEVLAMYAAWAERKGYEYTLIEPAAEQRAGRAAPAPLPPPGALVVKGSNVATILRGEAGLHRRSLGGGEERTRTVVRVAVLPVPENTAGTAADGLRATPAGLSASPTDGIGASDDAAIVRLYTIGRQQSVRDPRTGARATNVAAVLRNGEIDDFLLAWLRQAAAQPDGKNSSLATPPA